MRDGIGYNSFLSGCAGVYMFRNRKAYIAVIILATFHISRRSAKSLPTI